jgi:hypothetical protein
MIGFAFSIFPLSSIKQNKILVNKLLWKLYKFKNSSNYNRLWKCQKTIWELRKIKKRLWKNTKNLKERL